ncbi:PiT family inorganic phosphate transporter [Clostridium beijerinckii]|jgi:PiT family inorganic phosphate transporter|nr:PiT family inorganic phosphate transporter [Clostridium beijerinckii]NRU01333.1 PiT family inorganic phosphate transporter [Clostridium beijerinckii]NRU07872.1 PiT family inorganic phosphate transporter [Clostridium beijerinckii]NRU43357.1 PiT family inorganic phosphate transporter [Clostridium beijerinckii]NRU87070.1 PiT family inorganic phosphate transporter [Clostridium beijerinckii]
MTITVLIVITVLIFDFINGFHDTATAVATSITTRALKPQTAIVICAIFNFIGAFSGTAVAKTVGENIVSHNSMPQWVILGVLISAIIWNIITWYFGIPSSSSHALIGALVGGGIAYNLKFDVVNWYNLFHDVVIWIFIAPIIGFTVGYILMILLNWILKPFKPGIINKIFLKLQVVAGSLMALNHGSNDAQKSMGLITMALLSGGLISTFEVPTWVIACCAIAMALGTASGGKKIIKTMGSGMAKLTPVNGFAAQTGGAAVIFLATLFHAPVSTTHIISTTVMGVGASKRIKSVKWGVAQNIVWAWILTIPITAALSAFIIFIAKLFI